MEQGSVGEGRRRKIMTAWTSVMVGLLATACGITGLTLDTITSSIVDPAGDAFGLATNYDITKVVTTRETGGSTLSVAITFVQAVILPPPGSFLAQPSQAGAFISIDTDQNPATGGGSFAAANCGAGPTAVNMEFFVDGGITFQRQFNGNYVVVSAATFAPSGEATPSVSGNTLTLSIPLSALGGDDGVTHLDVLAANGAVVGGNPTDCAPDGSGGIVTRPQTVQRALEQLRSRGR